MKEFIGRNTKSKPVQRMINEALDILECVGIPLHLRKKRGLEKMAECFLAVAGVTKNWSKAKENMNLKSREIISFINRHFQENISPGSYDDIRRKDLKLLVLAGIVVNSGARKGSATNDPTRGYSLHPDFKNLIVTYGTGKWEQALQTFNKNKNSLSEQLARRREIAKVPVRLPDGLSFDLSLGEHNILQREIIEQFLPRFGKDCSVLYLGDALKKSLHIEREKLSELNFFDLSHDQLPDIIAYSQKDNWLYLIEAVHSSGPMSEIRVLELKRLLTECKAELIFITAFLTRTEFKKWMMDIAWETEVWIADNPDHLVHFNGHKFLGAY